MFEYNIENDHVLPPGPVLVEEVHQGQRHGEGAEEEVREGQVGDENVARCQHYLQIRFLKME